ncbi:MAG: ABC transporter substrate-binding protein [Dissulfuribacterales bacterium]
MKTVRLHLIVFLILCAFVVSHAAGPAMAVAADSPKTLIKTMIDSVLAALNEKGVDKHTKLVKVEEAVRQRFDFAEMSKRVIGPKWRELSDADKTLFTNLFMQLLEESYSSKIDTYAGDESVVIGNEIVQDNLAKVDTIIKSKNNDIPVDYKLYNNGKDWMVYDVIIEEVSLISTYRNTYAQILQKDGFNGLISQMKQKIEELQLSSPAAPNNKR